MDFDAQLIRFFGTADIDTLAPERLLEGVKLLQMQFGLERDSDRRFELWCLMYMLGVAPDPDPTFEDEADREAAHEFMAMADREIDEA